MDAALSSLGWTDLLEAAFAPYADTHLPARVTRVDRGAADLLAPVAGGTLSALRARTAGEPAVATGDWVAVATDAAGTDGLDFGVDVVLPRRTAIERAAASGRSAAQVLAANVDVVLVSVAAVPEPRTPMVERLVALAWDSGARPVVAVTKADLTPDAEAIAADLREAAPGVDVVTLSTVLPGGLAPLDDHVLPGQTVCLLGRSGAGKSTLANALLGAQVLATEEIRSDGKGRHTTTHRELFLLPGGGLLLDTPGLRGAGLWLSGEGLDRTFADIEELVGDCRFSDCGHVTEPGCAVRAAVDDGRLTQRRLDSWHKLQREAAWMASRTDARLRSEQRRAWKIVHQEVRRSGRIRP